MTLHQHITVLPLNHAPGQGWGANVLHRLVNPSDGTVPPAERSSLADFFADCTMGHLTLTGRVALQTILPEDDPDWLTVRTGTDPGPADGEALTRVVAKCRAAGATFDADDIILIVGSLPSDREFATRIRLDGRSHRVTYVSTATSHQVMAHELGHTLGFAHPYGLVHDVFGRATTEYGSPYCVMGPASRHHEVCTRLTPWPTFFAPETVPFFDFAGPRLSLAELVAWGMRSSLVLRPPTAGVAHEELPDEGWAEFSVTDQDGPADVPRVVVGRTSNGQVLTFEVRRRLSSRAVDWDAALDLRRATDLRIRPLFARRRANERDLHDSPGVVVHRIASVLDPDAETEDFVSGDAWLPHRAVYVGTIPLPLAGDTDLRWIDEKEWQIRALTADDGTVRLRVGTTAHPTEKGASVQVLRSHTAETGRVIVGPFEVNGVGEDCGVGQYYAFRITRQQQVLLQARSHGFDNPELCWVVEGHEVGWGRIGSHLARTITVPLSVEVPNGYQTTETQQHQVTLDVSTGWDQISLVVRGFPGRARVTIGCLVRGQGHTVAGASAQTGVEVLGAELEFPTALAEDVRACTGKFFDAIEDLQDRFPDLVNGAVLAGTGIKVPPKDWLLSQWQDVLASVAQRPELLDIDRSRLEELTRRRPL